MILTENWQERELYNRQYIKDTCWYGGMDEFIDLGLFAYLFIFWSLSL